MLSLLPFIDLMLTFCFWRSFFTVQYVMLLLVHGCWQTGLNRIATFLTSACHTYQYLKCHAIFVSGSNQEFYTVSIREQLWWDVVVVTLVQDPEGPVVDVINIAPRTANAVHNQILDVETQEGQDHQFWNLLQNKRTISESGSRFSSIDWCFRNLLIFAAPWCRVKTGENRELL